MHTVTYDGERFPVQHPVYQAMGLGGIGVLNRPRVTLSLLLNQVGDKLPSEYFRRYIEFCEIYSEHKQFLPDLDPTLWNKEPETSTRRPEEEEEQEGETGRRKQVLERTKIPEIADRFPYPFATFVEEHGDTGLAAVSLFAYEFGNFKVSKVVGALIARDILVKKSLTPDSIRSMFGITNDFTEEEERQIRRENRWVSGPAPTTARRPTTAPVPSAIASKSRQRTHAPKSSDFARVISEEQRRLIIEGGPKAAVVAADPRSIQEPDMYGYAFRTSRYTEKEAYAFLHSPEIWERYGVFIYKKIQTRQDGTKYRVFKRARRGADAYDTGRELKDDPGVYKLIRKNVQ